MEPKSRDLLTLILAGGAAGAASILIRLAGDVHYLAISFIRLGIATLAVALLALATRRINLPLPRSRDLILLATSGCFLGIHFIVFTYAVQFTSVSNATFLGDLGPVFVAVISPLILHERMTRRELGFICLALLGGLLAGGKRDSSVIVPTLSMGDLAAILAAFLAANYTVLGRLLRQRLEWLTYTTYVYATASLLVAAISLTQPTVEWTLNFPTSLLALVGLGLIPTFGGHSLYNLALGKVNAFRANMMLLLEPIIASILAYLLILEAPTSLQATGYFLISLSVVGVGYQISKATLSDGKV